MLIGEVAYVLSSPQGSLAYAISGKVTDRRMGAFYMGRANVHLLRFEQQGDSAQQNERRFGSDLGWIAARGWGVPWVLGRRYLPATSRSLPDYGLYINLGTSLWVWSKAMFEQQRSMAVRDPSDIVYEHQAITELMEYGYMLHRLLLDRAGGRATWSEVLAARRELLAHEGRLGEASTFGEIRNMLEAGWKEMEVPTLQRRIKEALAIRQDETAAAEARARDRASRALTVVFGFVAVPTLASEVLLPLWRYLGPPAKTDPNLLTLLAVGIAALPIIALTAWLMRKGNS